MKEQGIWHQRWKEGNIGWHRPQPNEHLRRHAVHIIKPKASVLVPLCGKSQDMVWLAKQGMTIVGIELVEQAAIDFYAEWGKTPTTDRSGKLIRYHHDPITIYCGDFFECSPEMIGQVDCIYDRAALVALPPSQREKYIDHELNFIDKMGKLLLITYEMPVPENKGPPFPVGRKDVPRLFQKSTSVKHLDEIVHTQETEPKLQKRGVDWSKINIWLITK
jgi:thiopurine S-methyltransferase